ncbi:MAG: M28 family metallopeptidase [Flavobacteriaceae bacterium]
MKHLFLFSFILLFLSCKTSTPNQASDTNQQNVQISPVDYENLITAEELKEHLYVIASDEMEGRMTGEPGQKKAAEYIRGFFNEHNIASPPGVENYFQKVPASFFREGSGIKDSENVIAFVEGSEYPEEVIIITAHYDHTGIDKNGNINNGADDDGSGTVATMMVAKAFQKAKDEGNGPKRSVAFLLVTGEEIGLFGSRYYTDESPVFKLEKTVANLNIDMIGRITPEKAENPNYIYLIGTDRLSTQLHNLSEEVNQRYVNLELDYKFNAHDDPNRFYYRSDHYNFAKHNIPVIFYFNGVHEDYHKHTDTPDKVEYELLEKRARLVYHTAWELANRKERIALDVNE